MQKDDIMKIIEKINNRILKAGGCFIDITHGFEGWSYTISNKDGSTAGIDMYFDTAGDCLYNLVCFHVANSSQNVSIKMLTTDTDDMEERKTPLRLEIKPELH